MVARHRSADVFSNEPSPITTLKFTAVTTAGSAEMKLTEKGTNPQHYNTYM